MKRKENLIEEILTFVEELSDNPSPFIINLPHKKYDFITINNQNPTNNNHSIKHIIHCYINNKYIGYEILNYDILNTYPIIILFFIKIQIKNRLVYLKYLKEKNNE
jgi:hypothetical protein